MLDRGSERGSSSKYGAMPSRSSDGGSPSAMAIPMIPGLVSTQRHFIGRTNFHKGQVLERMAQGRLTEPEDVKQAWPSSQPKKVNSTQPATVPATSPATTTNPSSTAFRSDATQPAWITHDRQVLRFFGYVLESVVTETHAAPPTQHDRVRRVVLFYYLSDGSLAISEPRVVNSGMAQGAFLKRTRSATKSTGEPFTPRDFSVGGRVRVYGRTLYLVDCDEATRQYYAKALSHPQGEPCKYPDDATPSQADEIQELKLRLKQKHAAVADSQAERARKFHANAQRVLRFYVSWRDPHPLYPETRKYTLHYYLSDDTVEIVEPKDEREGRGHFAVLLSRRQVAYNDGKGDAKRFLSERDLRCGEFVHVCARQFLLEDCDAFTRDYYLETHGVTQEKHEPEQQQRNDKTAKWKLFQVDPRALLAQVQGDQRQGKLDHSSKLFYQNDALEKKQLRFRARFHTGPHETTLGREFVLTFYLEDDTLSVFEPRVKNSGVTGGRFLDRGRFKKANSGSYVAASDLYVGAVVAFAFAPQQKLELIEADRQTLAYCESHADQFPFSNAQAVLASVAHACRTAGKGSVSAASVRRACRAVDVARNDTLRVGDVRRVLETLGLTSALNAQQLVTLCRAFEDNGDRGGNDAAGPLPFLYDDFCDALALAATSSSSSPSSDVLAKLRKCSALRRLLREADTQRQRVVATSELIRVVTAYKVSLSHSEALALATRFPGSHRQRRDVVVDYNALCDRVFDGESNERPTSPRKEQEPQRRTAKSPHKRGRLEEASEDGDGDYDVEWAIPNQHSLGRQMNKKNDQHSDDDEFDHLGDDDGDACLPEVEEPLPRGTGMASLESTRPQAAQRVPPLPRPLPTSSHSSALVAPRRDPFDTAPSRGSSSSTDPRVVALLRRAFGDRKYLLRKALRDRDHDKSGLLGEEAFMAAVLAVEPRLSDNDTYLLADVFFPTNNSHVDYTKLLESAFRV